MVWDILMKLIDHMLSMFAMYHDKGKFLTLKTVVGIFFFVINHSYQPT